MRELELDCITVVIANAILIVTELIILTFDSLHQNASLILIVASLMLASVGFILSLNELWNIFENE